MTSLRALLRDLELFEMACDQDAQLATLQRIADLATEQGRGSEALRACRLGLARAEAPADRAELYGRVGNLLLRRGHDRLAHGAYERAAAGFAEAGPGTREWGARLAAAIAQMTHDPDGARAALLALSRRLSAVPGREPIPWLRRVRLMLGELDLKQGRHELARLSAGNARALLSLEGIDQDGAIDSLEGRAELALGHDREAERLLARALDWFAAKLDRDDFARLGALEAYGWLELDRGRIDRAEGFLAQAGAMAERLGDLRRTVRIDLLRASAFLEKNPSETTRFILRAADRLLANRLRAPELVASLLELAAMLPSPALADQLRQRLS